MGSPRGRPAEGGGQDHSSRFVTRTGMNASSRISNFFQKEIWVFFWILELLFEFFHFFWIHPYLFLNPFWISIHPYSQVKVHTYGQTSHSITHPHITPPWARLTFEFLT
jgi:hypothetical protein